MAEADKVFIPDFAKGGGLLPVIAQDAASGEVLMLAYMNREAFEATLVSGEVHYWSRSRNCLWHKGGTSGHVQKLKSIRLDCDSDALLALVEQAGGAACHTGRRSCFYRELKDEIVSECSPVVFDPKEVYK
ncbi:MAG: phosphoribosyl-AMP cyclohydrolase [Desulfovibrio sp.]|jgi:phosphoribosyl-AMP cyclohydrolase|nr:phosphoribosyl-AMP cyclohydrolase [Desulfovibrio sp.]